MAPLLGLQEQHLYRRLSPAERKMGFISVGWTDGQLCRMLAASAVVIAECDGRLVGYYACIGLATDVGAIDYLYAPAARSVYAGRPLTDWRIAYGPQTCVDPGWRGRGIGTRLYHTMADRLSSRFDVMFGSVHRQNPGAIAFNVHGLRGLIVDEDDIRHFVVFDLRPDP